MNIKVHALHLALAGVVAGEQSRFSQRIWLLKNANAVILLGMRDLAYPISQVCALIINIVIFY